MFSCACHSYHRDHVKSDGYQYMLNAMWVSAMVGGLCAFLSCYLMLKGWSLIGDALSHSI
ncbi:metal ABC transporter permease, partial [Salmonella enterica subsp. enterica serovar Montevideo]|nr:metal ABC transporter permease [Salmonella enterica subsp. enterica serovar Montevideo]